MASPKKAAPKARKVSKKTVQTVKVKKSTKKAVPKITFEESLDRINSVINKLRQFWKLSAISWMDFDDVAQKIRIHLLVKWDKWDQSRKLEPWVYQTGRNQIKNLVRNIYYGSARPCLDCPANLGGDQCKLYGIQSGDCKTYAKWEKSKQPIYNAKFPHSIHDNHDPSGFRSEVCSLPEHSVDFITLIPIIDEKLREVLKENELLVYDLFFVKGKSEEQVVARLGFKSDVKRKNPRCKQFQNIKKTIVEKARVIIRELV